jgi:hypothetical protein
MRIQIPIMRINHEKELDYFSMPTHIKEIIVELYSSLMILQVKRSNHTSYGLYCQDENLLFSKLLVFCKTDDSGRERVSSRLVKVMNEDGLDYRYEWKGS